MQVSWVSEKCFQGGERDLMGLNDDKSGTAPTILNALDDINGVSVFDDESSNIAPDNLND